jgi:hypothetical protein
VANLVNAIVLTARFYAYYAGRGWGHPATAPMSVRMFWYRWYGTAESE